MQLSDLHLTADDREARSEPKLFGRLTGMNAAFGRLLADRVVQAADLVLVTGDVTDRGDPLAWQVFWEGLDAAGLATAAGSSPATTTCAASGVRPAASRGKRVAEDLAKLRAGLGQGGRAAEPPWAEVLAGGRVVLFGLDSSNPGNVSALTNAVGELGMPQLERLARLLRQHRDVPVKIVALHHSPNIPRAATARRRGLEVLDGLMRWGHEVPAADRRALRLLCVSHGVRLIVHGHLHRFEDRHVNGVRFVGAPASTEPAARDGRRGLPLVRYTLTTAQPGAGRERGGLGQQLHHGGVALAGADEDRRVLGEVDDGGGLVDQDAAAHHQVHLPPQSVGDLHRVEQELVPGVAHRGRQQGLAELWRTAWTIALSGMRRPTVRRLCSMIFGTSELAWKIRV